MKLLFMAVVMAFAAGVAKPAETTSVIGGGEAANDPASREALAIWQGYLQALREADRHKAMGYWSEEATRENPIFDWQLPRFDEAVDLARRDSLRVTEVSETPGVTRLLVGLPTGRHTYYVVRTGPKAVLANPVEVLTSGWSVRETKHLICHGANGDLPDAEQTRELDDFCATMSSYLGIPLRRKIDYYKCSSGVEVGELFGMEPATGRAYYANYAVADVNWKSFHEIAHVMLGQTCRNQPTSLILEGAACYFGGSSLVTRDTQLAWAKTLVEHGEAAALASLARDDGFWAAEDMNDPYALAASIAGFLLDRYGVDKFKALYTYRDRTDSVATAITDIYDRDIKDLDGEWRQWTLARDVAGIELGASSTAKEVFRMEDPAGDDDGDGAYQYPVAARYKPGMFDLTEFRVSADEGRAWFDLAYRDLVEWEEDSPWGFDGTYTRIAVDNGSQGDSGFGRDAHATLAGRRTYLINVSDCGVVVWHESRVYAILKRPLTGTKLGDAKANRIRFSIPLDEGPEERWRYTVAVGGCTGRGPQLRDAAGEFFVVGERPSEDTGGGGRSAVSPNFYDIVLPAEADQEKVLSDYDEKAGRLVILPMFGR